MEVGFLVLKPLAGRVEMTVTVCIGSQEKKTAGTTSPPC